MDYSLCIKKPARSVLAQLLTTLTTRGLKAVTSFDLQLAQAGCGSCACPHHGTGNCTCQYLVLLVFDPTGPADAFGTITLHGRDDTVWLTLLSPPGRADDSDLLQKTLETALLDTLRTLSMPSQVTYAE